MSKALTKEILAPLIDSEWRTDEHNLGQFKYGIEHHKYKDNESGITCRYNFKKDTELVHAISGKEFYAMKKHIDEEFIGTKGDSLNQHYLHSLQQMYSEIQKSYDEHIKRTDDLKGTPAGRIFR